MFHDLSYLAGLLDGEGSIGFYGNGKNAIGTNSKRFTMEITLANESVIDWLAINFGGQKQKKLSKLPNHQTLWRWRLSWAKAMALYKRVQPYLKIKTIK